MYFRVGRFKRYLVSFGVRAEIVGDNVLAIIGVVPFQSEVATLCSIPRVDGVEIYKDEICRFISWSEIESVRHHDFWGKSVLILRFSRNTEFNKLVVPWCEEINEFIPEILNSL